MAAGFPVGEVAGDGRQRCRAVAGHGDVDAMHRLSEAGLLQGPAQLRGQFVGRCRLARLPQVHVEDGPFGGHALQVVPHRGDEVGQAIDRRVGHHQVEGLAVVLVVGYGQAVTAGVDEAQVIDPADPVVAPGGHLEDDVAHGGVAMAEALEQYRPHRPGTADQTRHALAPLGRGQAGGEGAEVRLHGGQRLRFGLLQHRPVEEVVAQLPGEVGHHREPGFGRGHEPVEDGPAPVVGAGPGR